MTKKVCVFFLWAVFLGNTFSQNSDLLASCVDGRLTIIGANDLFLPMGVPPATRLVSYLYFGEGDAKNGHHTSQTIQAVGNFRKMAVFSDINYCSSNAQEFPTFALGVQVGNEWKTFVFMKGKYVPGRTTIRLCGETFSCNDSILRFEVYESNFCFSRRSNGMSLNFGPGSPLNQLNYAQFYCTQTDLKGILTTAPGVMDCFNGCASITGKMSYTIDNEVCHYENWKLVQEPVCFPHPPPLNTGPDACGTLLNECLPEVNAHIWQNQGELLCRQWKQMQAPCDPDKWAFRSGSVSIGTANSTGYKLSVKDGVITNEARVENCSGWCDYVFKPTYRLMPLPLLKDFVAAHQHLPDTPSAKDVESGDGIDAEKVIVNHQLKIEEIFLHLIALQKETVSLQAEYEQLCRENARLKAGNH